MKLNQKGNSYFINSARSFTPNTISQLILEKSFDFSYQMVFGEGHHRNNRSGGQLKRKNGELFCNTFQGKLSEVILHELFTTKKLICSEPDFEIMGKGEWDDIDLIVNTHKLNIKSCAHFSNLLLLETKDWDNNGNYIPNKTTAGTSSYDYFILVRINPDIKAKFKEKLLFYSNNIDYTELKNIIFSMQWSYDIGGTISNKTLKHIIEHNYILPQNSMLNDKTEMDAENYYVQCGNMKSLSTLLEALQAD